MKTIIIFTRAIRRGCRAWNEIAEKLLRISPAHRRSDLDLEKWERLESRRSPSYPRNTAGKHFRS